MDFPSGEGIRFHRKRDAMFLPKSAMLHLHTLKSRIFSSMVNRGMGRFLQEKNVVVKKVLIAKPKKTHPYCDLSF